MKNTKLFILVFFLFTSFSPALNAQCSIDDVEVEFISCDGNFFSVGINFIGQAVADSFTVNGNGTQYGTFAYSNLPITIDGIEGNGSTVYEFIITDTQIGCSNFGGIGPIDCSNPDCLISDIQVTNLGCNAIGTYGVEIDFNFQNVNNDFFDLFINGTFYDFYEFTNLPITIIDVPYSGNLFDLFTICQNDNQACCSSFEFEAPDCSNSCSLTNLVAEAALCDANGMFSVGIDFNIQNPPSDSFTIVGNGNNYGTFAYADLYVTIGPFEGDGTTIYEFVITDQNDPNCSNFTTIDPVDCNNTTCAINDLIAEAHPCGPDGSFLVDVDFNIQNPPSDSFQIEVNGIPYERFHYDDLVVTFGSQLLIADGSTIYDIYVYDINDSSCSANYLLGPIDCGSSNVCLGFEELAINTVFGTPNEQIDDVIFTENNIPVKIQGFGNDFMNVVIQDNNLPNFSYSNFSNNFLSFVIASLEYNFLQSQNPVIRVEFDYWQNGGGMLIGANDATPTTINGQQFSTLSGTEIAPGITLTVTPNPNNPELGHAVLDGFIGLFLIGGEDAFAIDNVCVEYASLGDCWSGDTDLDNLVSNFDLLNIGVAYGETGTPRQNANIGWLPQPSDDWTQVFESGVNVKHADTNGDGIVNADDKFAIEQNYNLTHGNVEPFTPPSPNPNDPLLYIQMPNPQDIVVGQPFEAEIHIGDPTFQISDLYGMAFTLNFNDQIFDASSMQIIFENGWFNSNGADDLLTMQHKEDGNIQAAMTRINQTNMSGFGKIGKVIGIIDDLSGYSAIELNFTNVKVIQSDEGLIPITIAENYMELITNGTHNPLNESLLIFPNPSSDLVVIRNETMELDQIRLINILGKEVLRRVNINATTLEIDIKQLPEGIYFLEIQSEGYSVSRKIKIEHP